jgi:hypothetical protein
VLAYAAYPRFAGLGAPPLGLGAPAFKILGDKLWPNQSLHSNEGLKSKNGRVQVLLQTDGNCVLYGDGKPLWWTGVRPGVNQAVMQIDGNFVLYKPGEGAVWASDTAGHPGGYLFLQDDANFVLYWGVGGSALWSSQTNGFRYYGGPGKAISLDDIADALSDALSVAEIVISFVPVVGAGVNAAIAAGAALARGENITDAIVAGAKNALPGGPIAAKAFDMAYAAGKALIAGGSIEDASIAAARAALPEGPAQQAFDVGLAIAHGQNMQQILVTATSSLSPEAGRVATAIFKDPNLRSMPPAEAAKTLKTDAATVAQAVAAIDKATPPSVQTAAWQALASLTPDQQRKLVEYAAQAKKREDAWKALASLTPEQQTQIRKLAEQKAQAKKPPTMKEAPSKVVVASKPPSPRAYAPYPKSVHPGAVSAPPMHIPHHPGEHHGGGHPVIFRGGRAVPGWWGGRTEVILATETCRAWGDLVSISPGMQVAAKIAVGASGGRPTTLRGDGGALYLISLESGVLTARPCTSVVTA